MSYDDKEPYKRLEYGWKNFKRELKAFENALDELEKKTVAKPKSPEDIEREILNECSFMSSGSTIEAFLFLLPSPYRVPNVQEVLTPETAPALPTIPTSHPSITLSLDQYPSWYLDGFNEGEVSPNGPLTRALSFMKFERSQDPLKPSLLQRDINVRREVVQKYEELKRRREEIKASLKSRFDNELGISKAALAELTNSPSVEAVCNLIAKGLDKAPLPDFLRMPTRVTIDRESKILLLGISFPDYADRTLATGWANQGRTRAKVVKGRARHAAIKKCLCSLAIRALKIGAALNVGSLYESVVVNVDSSWFDPATGQPRQGTIASVQASISVINSLDLAKIEPEATFKYLKGLVTPSVEAIQEIRPIYTVNKDDKRLIESRDVGSELMEGDNLAAMDWDDFEHLVAQLFEWEFVAQGIEVRVTQASRDRGVDAILFDPDPLKGGKYVIQAKRYTRTVDVSAVRDLYGTVMNEGANRGILITTASFGPDSYDFAKDKPISLVDGPNLLRMFEKHGRNFRVDLVEARASNLGLK